MITTMLKKAAFLLVAGLIGICGLEPAGQLPISGASRLVSPAEAKVGRPLTPVSVAGATRRTARRCAAGVYNC
jgi:hypothetical protein